MSRISKLPRRDWRAKAEPFVSRLSAMLATERGRAAAALLRLVQVACLLEARQLRGLFCNARVGAGKTLVAALLGALFPDSRVLVLCPGGIKKETRGHFGKLAANWAIPQSRVELMSYHDVSNMPRLGKSLAQLFGGQGPSIIVCDEADKLKNVGPGGSALANQINDWMVAHPETVFIVLTGTCDVEGLLDYGHLLDWALRDLSPLPRTRRELEDWSEVIDQGDMTKAQWVCQDLGIPEDSDLDAIREAYRERLHDTPGVIIDDTPYSAVPLTVAVHVMPQPAELESHFVRLRMLWQRPDGFDVAAGGEETEDREPDRIAGSTIWTVARRMGRGLCYVCDPRPPEPWLLARRKWNGRVRAWIESGAFLTEAVARAHAERVGESTWLAWSDVKDSFTPNQKTIWLSEATLRWAEEWGSAGPGVIWTDDIAFATELARRTGWPYYGGGGLTSDGRYIEDSPRGSTVIASRRANSTGRNLQYQWNRCLFTAPVSKSRDFEQAVGRFHREGLETWATGAHADILLTCSEDIGAQRNMLASARRTARNIYSQKAATLPWAPIETPDSGAAYGHLPESPFPED